MILNEKQEQEWFTQHREQLLKIGFDADTQSKNSNSLFIVTDQHIYAVMPKNNSSILRSILLSDMGKSNQALSFRLQDTHSFYPEVSHHNDFYPEVSHHYDGYIEILEGIFSEFKSNYINITYKIPSQYYTPSETDETKIALERDSQLLTKFKFRFDGTNEALKLINVTVKTENKSPERLIQPLILLKDLPNEKQRIEISVLKKNYRKIILNTVVLRPVAIVVDIITSPLQLIIAFIFKDFNPIR